MMGLSSFFSRIMSAAKPKALVLPKSWLPKADVRRVHLHWTAGSYVASALDKEHYHFLVTFENGVASVERGKHSVRANVPPLRKGRYAQHTYHANSHAIGIGICAMKGATDRPLKAGRYPLTKKQWDKAVELTAIIAREYDIDVLANTILTHAEVQSNIGVRQRGKWDIAWLPFLNNRLSARDVGLKLRTEVRALV